MVTLLRELLQVRLDKMPVAQVSMLTSSEPSWVTRICSRPSNPSYRERPERVETERDKGTSHGSEVGEMLISLIFPIKLLVENLEN